MAMDRTKTNFGMTEGSHRYIRPVVLDFTHLAPSWNNSGRYVHMWGWESKTNATFALSVSPAVGHLGFDWNWTFKISQSL